MRFAEQAENLNQPLENLGLKPLPSLCNAPGIVGKVLLYIPVLSGDFEGLSCGPQIAAGHPRLPVGLNPLSSTSSWLKSFEKNFHVCSWYR